MRLRLALLVLLAIAPRVASAQQTSQPAADAIRVYLDCSYFCDNDFLHTEINYVNWVRDQTDAQLHIIVSRLQTGGGGNQYTFTFTGRKDFLGREDTLRYVSKTTDSEDVVRRGIAQILKLGMVPFIAQTSGATRLQVSWAAPTAEAAKDNTKAHDPWNYWVFTISANSNFNGESSQNFTSMRGNISANRTTEAFKLRVGLNTNYNESNFTYDPGNGTGDTTITSIRKNKSFNLLGVKSINSHWSTGLQAGANSGTFGNIELGLNAGPAIEYSVWPYSETTRRSLAFRYNVGINSYDYREITIYGMEKETHPKHSLAAELDMRQRFGSINLSLDFSQYLHNTSFYNASAFTNANIMVFKGFSVNFYGSYQKVHDQLALSAADLTPEEVLLQQRQLATSYYFFGGIGLRYSFGSIFNNVVNPRFGEGGGGVMIMN